MVIVQNLSAKGSYRLGIRIQHKTHCHRSNRIKSLKPSNVYDKRKGMPIENAFERVTTLGLVLGYAFASMHVHINFPNNRFNNTEV